MPGRPGARFFRPAVLIGLGAALLAGCAAPRIVPVPASGVEIDATQGSARVAAQGVELAVQPSAWRGRPADLDDYVTPFFVSLSNGAAEPLVYDYTGFRLFDDARFQYSALPPAEVERILRWRADDPVRMAAIASPPPILRRRGVVDPDWWWDRYRWYGWPWYDPWYYFPPPSDIYLNALPMGPLQPGARVEGFVYFLRLRKTARALTLEFHHQLGGRPSVLALSFAVERDGVADRPA